MVLLSVEGLQEPKSQRENLAQVGAEAAYLHFTLIF